ncbi:hypothetical protein, partial [Aeromonas caviae]|uniref:hypothetical protein n=1 Tax=Aeromonas caviae TaxID=648 RepID=UPI001CC3B237
TQAPQSLSLPDFDAAAEVLLLKAETKIRRKRCFNQTRVFHGQDLGCTGVQSAAGLVEATLATDLGLGLEQQ